MLPDERIAALEARVKELEAANDGYRHLLISVRSKMRGILTGALKRWIEESYDVTLDEQFGDSFSRSLVKERMADASKLIRVEVDLIDPLEGLK